MANNGMSMDGGLPPAAARLVGREVEVGRLVEMVRSADGRLLTITGAGGCGKTRLAIEIAHTLAGGFADGAAFVDLAALRDPQHVVGEVVRALGFVDRSNKPAPATSTSASRPSTGTSPRSTARSACVPGPS